MYSVFSFMDYSKALQLNIIEHVCGRVRVGPGREGQGRLGWGRGGGSREFQL